MKKSLLESFGRLVKTKSNHECAALSLQQSECFLRVLHPFSFSFLVSLFLDFLIPSMSRNASSPSFERFGINASMFLSK